MMRTVLVAAAATTLAGAHDAAAAIASAHDATGEYAHPGSHNGEGDTVHYCLPGPIDYALDEVIRVLRRSFDQAPRFYGV